MKKTTRLKIGPFALLVLLVLLALLAVHRKGLRAEEAEDEVVGAVVKLDDAVVRDKYAAVAFLALMALFAFVTWVALRAKEGQDTAKPPARESPASDRTAFR